MHIALYIESQDPSLQEKLWAFHRFISDSHPAIQTTIKYGVPFYVLKKNLCYLCVQKGKVVLGFIDAHLQPGLHEFVDFTGRSQIGHFVWQTLDDRCFTDLHQALTQAIEFNLSGGGKR